MKDQWVLYGAGALALFALFAMAKRNQEIDVILPADVIWYE